MNEVSAKKLGEVLAFSRVGIETAERANVAYGALFGEGAEVLITTQQEHIKSIESIAKLSSSSEIMLKKAEATATKLRAMRELYVGDEWENPSEIAEWLGFFEGAAIVHWALVEGVASALNHADLLAISQNALQFHERLLTAVKSALSSIGKASAA